MEDWLSISNLIESDKPSNWGEKVEVEITEIEFEKINEITSISSFQNFYYNYLIYS